MTRIETCRRPGDHGMEGSTTSTSRTRFLDLVALKRYALEKLHPASPLRELLLSEKDRLNVEEFMAKMDLWLRLMRREVRQ